MPSRPGPFLGLHPSPLRVPAKSLQESLPPLGRSLGKLFQLPGQTILGNGWRLFKAIWEMGRSLICGSVIKTENVCSLELLMAFRSCKLDTNREGLLWT